MITLAAAARGDEDKIAALCAELDGYYGDAAEGTPEARAKAVADVLFGSPPLAYALLAWDGPELASNILSNISDPDVTEDVTSRELAAMAAYSFLWPAEGLTASLYLKELYVAVGYRHAGVGRMLMDELGAIAGRRGLSRVEWTTDASNAGAQSFYEALGAKPLTSKIFYRAVLRSD